MSILNILSFPDPKLRTVAKNISNITAAHKKLSSDMLETMYAADGIGLAATQINVHQRLIVMDLTEEKNQSLILINPEILEFEGSAEGSEGCLSVPEQHALVQRHEWIKCRALDLNGKTIEIETDGLLSVCIQHEIDHLDGKLFVDYISKLKRDRIRKKLIKLQHK